MLRPRTHPLHTGSLVGPYRVLEKIGAGGMGEVYLAHDTRLDRRVALKRLTGHLTAETARRRLDREARAAARLNHPNIAAIYDLVEDAQDCYIVMEFVDGQSLGQLPGSSLSIDRIIDIAVQLADALAYAHARGVVHCDVKPANVRVGGNGAIKLLDLGIAALLDLGVDAADTAAAATRTAGVQGTPAYMAPERFRGPAADARADVCSLGVLLYELATGRTPYVATDFVGQALAIAQRPAPRARSLNADVPPDLDAVLTRALERDPALRFPTAGEFATALRTVQADLARPAAVTVVPAASVSPSRQRRWRIIGASAAIVASVAAIPASQAIGRWRAHTAARSAYENGRLQLDHTEQPGNVDRAESSFISAVKQDPGFAVAHAGLADVYSARYRLQKDPALAAHAREEAEAAARLDPNQPEVHTALGAIKRLTGEREAAIVEFNKALSLQPPDSDAHRLLGQTLAEQGRVDEGIAEIKKAIQIRPDHWNNHFTLGFVLYSAARYEEAAAEYRRTTELTPNYAGAYQMLGTTLHKLGDVEGAIGNYEHAVRLGPSAPAYSNLAFFYFSSGRLTEAIAAYTEATRLDPATPSYHRNLADVYRRAGNDTAARLEYQRAIDTGNAAVGVNRRDGATIALVALAEARLGRLQQAERHAAEAAAISGGNRDVLGRQAQVLALI